METIYLETTIVGHLVGRMRRDPLIAARQQVPRDWWRDEASKYTVLISQLVLDECSDGDPEAAAERLEAVKNLDLLDVSDEVAGCIGCGLDCWKRGSGVGASRRVSHRDFSGQWNKLIVDVELQAHCTCVAA